MHFARLLFLALLCLGLAAGQYLETTVRVGDTPFDVIWSPLVNKVYCSNSQDGTMTVISGESNQVLATVQVGDYPTFLCLNGDGSKVYCSHDEDGGWVSVTCGAGDTLIRRVRLPGRGGRSVCNDLMNKLYVQCNDDPIYDVVVIDAGPDTVLKRIPVHGVGALLWHPVSNRVFCAMGSYDSMITVIDCVSDEVAQRPRIPDMSASIWCYNSVNGLVYLSGSNAVYALSPAGESLVAAVPAAGKLCFAPFPNKVFAAGGGVIRIIDGGSNQILDSLIVGGGGMNLVCDTEHGKTYCSNTNARKVDIIDAREDTLIKSIPLGRSPALLCWNSTNSRVYISDQMDDVVYVIRDTSSGVGEGGGSVRFQTVPAATVVRGVLRLPHETTGLLVDMSGRRVAALEPGENDVRFLSPGVYFAVRGDRCRAKFVVAR